MESFYFSSPSTSAVASSLSAIDAANTVVPATPSLRTLALLQPAINRTRANSTLLQDRHSVPQSHSDSTPLYPTFALQRVCILILPHSSFNTLVYIFSLFFQPSILQCTFLFHSMLIKELHVFYFFAGSNSPIVKHFHFVYRRRLFRGKIFHPFTRYTCFMPWEIILFWI